MYDSVSPPRIFFCNDVLQDDDAAARAERIIGACPASEVIRFDRDDLADVARQYGFGSPRVRMGKKDEGDPPLFLTRARFTDPASHADEVQAVCDKIGGADERVIRFLLGYFPWNAVWLGGPNHDGEIRMGEDMVCRPAWRLHTMYGCPHHCVYCSYGFIIPIYVNLDEYVGHLHRLMAANPWEKVFLYDDAAEALYPEPELGAIEAFVKCCQRFPDRHLVIHTKSANVDFLESLDHQGRCILTWSLTSSTQSQVTERASGTMAERIDAARRCASWGYPVRVKFKPIVPFKNWRDEAREMIREILTVDLDNISLFTIAWMDVDELKACFPVDQLDPDYLREAEQAKEEMKNRSVRPYPHHVRAEIYRFFLAEIRKHNAHVPVTLCTEALDMWQEMGSELGQTPGSFVCGCGPMTVPGYRRLKANPWRSIKPVSAWADPAEA